MLSRGEKTEMKIIESVWGHRAGDPHRLGQENTLEKLKKTIATVIASSS